MCWVNRQMTTNRHSTTHTYRYQQNHKSSASSADPRHKHESLCVKVYKKTTKIFSDGVLACLYCCTSVHSKLAAENRQAAGPFASNGKHNKTCGIARTCSTNCDVTCAVQTALQHSDTKFSTAGFNREAWRPPAVQPPRNSCDVNLPHSDTELVIATVKLKTNC